MGEDNYLVRKSVRGVSRSLVQQIEAVCAEDGINFSMFAKRALKRELDAVNTAKRYEAELAEAEKVDYYSG